ncbi:hypothetical protein ABTE87_22190, partial [Acinetobacter baumannii]
MEKDKLHFRQYLLNERAEVLTHRLGDIITAVKDLNDNSANLGARLLVKRSQVIVNMIRRILHT